MAHYYSSLYEALPFRGGAPVLVPRSPNTDHRAGNFAEIFTVAMAGIQLLANDVVHLIPSTPAGFRVTRFTENAGDWDSGATLVLNIGFLSQASGLGLENGVTAAGASLGTKLQTGAIYTMSDTLIMTGSAALGPQTATLNLLPAGANDELVLFVTTQAAGAGTAALAQFLVEATIP